MPEPESVSPDLQRLLDWIDAQGAPTDVRLTHEQLETSAILGNALSIHPRTFTPTYGYSARPVARAPMPLPGDVLGW